MTGPALEGMRDNAVLSALPRELTERLMPHFEPIVLAPGRTIYQPDDPFDHLYFPLRCLISVLNGMRDGEPVELFTVGREGFVGASFLMGAPTALFETVVRIGGPAIRMRAALFRREINADEACRQVLQRYLYAAIQHVAHSMTCGRVHSLDQRCRRWLLGAADAAGDSFPITHEALALAIGVRRPGVTTALAALQREGVIAQQRGRITILDRTALEARACECYDAVRGFYRRALGAATWAERPGSQPQASL